MVDFSGMFNAWIAVLTKPVESLKAEAKSKNGMKEGAIGYAIAGLIAALLILVVGLAFGSSMGAAGFALAGFGAIFMAAMAFVMLMAATFVEAGLIHLSAKLLGGKGGFGKFYYLTSTFLAPIFMANMVLSFVPCIGMLASIALFIYSAYLFVITIRELYGLDNVKAFIAWLLPIIVVVGLMVLAMMGIAMLGFFPGAMYGSQPATSYGALQAESNAYWMSARPFQIRASSQISGSGQLALRVQNTDPRALTITGVSVRSSERTGNYGTPTTINGGETATLAIPIIGSPCRPGDKYSYQITFSYDDPAGVSGQKQYGAKELMGACN
ncbi:MAG: YIP1 family protein [Candidatus Marsarchaeota archaeon]|nr:YIP1 family protein [Candidatus Marsarchaeota archaeon]